MKIKKMSWINQCYSQLIILSSVVMAIFTEPSLKEMFLFQVYDLYILLAKK